MAPPAPPGASYGRRHPRSRVDAAPAAGGPQEGAGELFLSEVPALSDEEVDPAEESDFDDAPSDLDDDDSDLDGVDEPEEEDPVLAPPPSEDEPPDEPESDEAEDEDCDFAPDFAASRLSFL